MSEESKDEMNLVEEAENWTQNQVEERFQDLLNFIHPVLLDENSEYALRLECVRFTVEKLARHVPVFEAEDNVFYPLLNGVLEFLKQVYQSISRTDDSNRVMLISVATALINHTDILLVHGSSYDGLGPGEIPSIPRMIPKILLKTFQYCSQEQANTDSDEVKESVTRLFCGGRTLLENFCALVDKMRIRSVLADELDIVLELCSDLLAFHDVLFLINLKSCHGVWKLYAKLTKEHCERLRLKLDMEAALVVLIAESVRTFRKLESVLQEETENLGKKANRLIISLIFLVKTTVNLTEQYPNLVRTGFAEFSDFLGFMFLQGANIFPFMEPPMISRLEQDLFLQNHAKSLLLSIPDLDKFCEFLLTVQPEPSSAFTRVQILMLILETDATSENMKPRLLDSVLRTFGYCEAENQKPAWLESPEIPGNQVKLFSPYEWVLTRVSGVISVLGPDNFPELEITLFKNLLGDQNLTCELCCDILCFIGRYGSADLCYSHLELISDILTRLDNVNFSMQQVWLGSLVGRLFNFLGRQEQRRWVERFSPVEPKNLVLWSKINLQSLSDKETLTLLQDVTFSTYNLYLQESSTEQGLTDFPYILRIFAGLVTCSLGANFKSVVITLWEKIAGSGLGEFFTALIDLTVSVLSNLTYTELKTLISNLVQLSGSARNQGCSYFVGNMITILLEVSELDWVGQIENMDPCLIIEIGNLSSSCLRTAMKNPILKISGLTYLRNIAERSNNPGFIRLCSDEKDILPHFTLFLKQDHCSSGTENTSVTFDMAVPNLEYFVNKDDGTDAEVKRKISSSSISPRKKKLRVGGEEDDTPGEILSKLEANLDSLATWLRQPGDRALTGPERRRLRELSSRVSKMISLEPNLATEKKS
jgi:hypothetical protein